MKTILFIIVTLALAVSCATPKEKLRAEFDAQMDEWDSVAATYPEKNTELSVFSKYAIMKGQPYVAESVNMKAYKAYKDVQNRQMFVKSSLYQIFLVFIDKHNKERDIDKSKYYLDKLEREFPNSEEAVKAREIYANSV